MREHGVFMKYKPTSKAINEAVCVKSSYFNEPSMTCCKSNRLSVLYVLFYKTEILPDNFWDVQGKNKINRPV